MPKDSNSKTIKRVKKSTEKPENENMQQLRNESAMARKIIEEFENKHNAKSDLFSWFINNKVAANILMLFFIIGGILSVKSMRTETFPSIDPNIIAISVAYPGASPYEVAQSITTRSEQALSGINGVKRISSTAGRGSALTLVELYDYANSDDVLTDVETSINSLVNFPPNAANKPVIRKIKLTPSVMNLAVHGDVTERALKYWVEKIEEEIKALDGVALTSLSGIRNYEISIEISEILMRKYAVNFSDIARAISEFSQDIPAGKIESNNQQILLRIQEKKYTTHDIENIIIRSTNNGGVLKIKDVARVIDGFQTDQLISKYNNQRAGFIEIKRSDTEDTLTVANHVKKYLSTLTLPKNLNISIARDETNVLLDRISLMLRNGIIGFMLVFVILALFLDLKLAFWTSAAIPTSFLGGLMIMNYFGQSINMITLFGLIVVLGIVVDDGIVAGESIFEAQKESDIDSVSNKEKEDKSVNAALLGLRRVIAPVTVGVMTTMAAFAPLMFSSGTLGQIIGVIPVVVISILFVSLLEAYFILPAHLSSSTRWSMGVMSDIRNKIAGFLQSFIDNLLVPFTKRSIKYKYRTLLAFAGFLLLGVLLMKFGFVRFLFFPQIESDRITITAKMHVGTAFSVTERNLNRIERAVIETEQHIISETGKSPYKSSSITIGASQNPNNPMSSIHTSLASNIGQVRIQLVPSNARSYSAHSIEKMIRSRMPELENVDNIKFQSSLIGDNPDIEIELAHPNNQILNQASEDLKNMIKELEGTREVTDSYTEGAKEFVFELTELGVASGLTPAYLGNQLRSGYFGQEAQRIQRENSEIIIYVRYSEEERNNAEQLENIRIRMPDGRELPLLSVAKIKESRGDAVINSVNGRRVVNVSCSIDKEILTPSAAVIEISSNYFPKLREIYPGIKISFEGETRSQKDDMASLIRNMLTALLIIFVLLGAQLRSYIQPFVIMSAIPFGIIGAIFGHFLLGYDLTFISLFGIVALSGVVVNDSVVLVDYLNKQKNLGKSVEDSAILAVARRFRPILLTTLSTCLGLLPMLLETSLQAQFLLPMVISLATGIVFATVIILLLVPCLVLVIEDIKEKINFSLEKRSKKN